MTRLYVLLSSLILISCHKNQQTRSVHPELSSSTETTSIVVTGGDLTEVKTEAAKLGLTVEGNAVLQISGNTEALKSLRVSKDNLVTSVIDQPIRMVKESDSFKTDAQAMYMAKRDFGLVEYLAANPTHDGRGVIVGVIDDGISPSQSGFKKTSTGERKLLAKKSQSSLLTFSLTEITAENPGELSPFAKSVEDTHEQIFVGSIDEAKLNVIGEDATDLNDDEVSSVISLAVFKTGDDFRICVDQNIDLVASKNECFGTFARTGDYGFWDKDSVVSFVGEFDASTKKLSLGQGEYSGDSHGEGVASVMAGHSIGGLFDGVAPGAQILDYDLSEASSDGNESAYTIFTFLKALEWLGQNGADVCNVSYSLFFYSAESQGFMQKALEKITNTYGMNISFSAGNNGPGLSSFNRGLIYPSTALVAGAFVSKDLDEYVHGVTGLPEEGRVVWYSSRGPAPDGGSAPTVISPLSSLTHKDPSSGFGAFSGTSSAAPALGGLAAVMISALKQEGLAIDNLAVVNAIRMSGVPLPGVAFVEQGRGLPKIERAIEIYRKMIKGSMFAKVNAAVTGGQIVRPGAIPMRGITLFRSELNADHEYTVRLSGLPSNLVSGPVGTEILRPLRIEYSDSWLEGAKGLHVSIGGSAFMVRLRSDLLPVFNSKGSEVFGEIRLIDAETNELLEIVPVTIIEDLLLNRSVSYPVSLSAQEGKRFHVQVPADAVGVQVVYESETINGAAPNVSAYSPDAVKTFTMIAGKLRSVGLATTDKFGGWHQFAVTRSSGSTALMSGKLTLTPIKVRLATSSIASTKSALRFINAGSELDFKVQLLPKPQDLTGGVVPSIEAKPVSYSWPITSEGVYSVAVNPAVENMISFWRPACFSEKILPTGERSGSVSEVLTIIANTADVGSTLKATCYPFETGSEVVGSIDFAFSATFAPKSTQGIAAAKTECFVSPGASACGINIDSLVAAGIEDFRVEILPLDSAAVPIVLGSLKKL